MTDKIAELSLLVILFALLLLVRSFRVANLYRLYIPAAGAGRRGMPLEVAALMALALVTMVLIPLIDLLRPWLDFADFAFRGSMAWVGLAIGAAAVWVFWRAQQDWLRYHAPDCPALIEKGIYRFMRHPFYTALLLLALAQALLLQNWLAGPAAVATFLLIHMLRLPLDEQTLLERFGQRYLEYMDRTGSLLPRILYRRG
jgi:protein-S-isoprenylcysteine O-methyltransferase Ste14